MLKRIFLISFMLVLWLPMLQMVTGFPHQSVVDENRKLAEAPVLKSWADTKQFTGDAIKWFDDHFGFRGFLIRSKTQIDYSAFGMSTRVYIGTDGWLFYRTVMDNGKPQIELALRNDADKVVQGTWQLASALKARNIKLVIMIAPMKDVYYGDHLPDTAKKLPEPRQIELLQDRLRGMKEILFLDSEAILREVAKKRTVFHRTDFHWNDPAAFEVAQVLVNEIGRLEGRTSPVWKHALELEQQRFSGGEAMFMPLYFPPKETGWFVKQNWVQPPNTVSGKQPPFEWIYENTQPTALELPAMTVLGDSFFDGMLRSGICVYFKKVYRASWNDTSMKEMISKLPPDTRYFFVEFIENQNMAYTALAAEASK